MPAAANSWLLVPPESRSPINIAGYKKRYDMELSFPITQTITEIAGRPSRAGRLDDRGTGSPRGLRKIVAAARRSGCDNVGCIILERGDNDQGVPSG